jgi:dTDP-4-amino-4,6-dideoxygalactose transaminase
LIPFNKPVWLGTELDRIREALTANGHAAGGGPFGRECEVLLRERYRCRALLVTSGTHALEMAALLLDLEDGDEVIIPSYTFVSTANAFVLRKARPVFADVDDHGNVDPVEVERLVGPRTRAIVPVHYGGSSCDMGELVDRARRVPIVEDAAQAIGASFLDKPLGTFGTLAALSFHETKNVGCGEGGALLVRDERWLERAEYLREKGTNRSKFQAGMVDKYTWVDVGSSYVLSDLNAAYLRDQLRELDRIHRRRAEVHERYAGALGALVESRGGYVVRSRPENTPNHHLFAIVFRTGEQRTRFIHHMREHGIIAPFHYVGLHLSPFGARFHDGRSLPRTERLTSCLVRLPLFFNITDEEVDRVVDRTAEFLRAL